MRPYQNLETALILVCYQDFRLTLRLSIIINKSYKSKGRFQQTVINAPAGENFLYYDSTTTYHMPIRSHSVQHNLRRGRYYQKVLNEKSVYEFSIRKKKNEFILPICNLLFRFNKTYEQRDNIAFKLIKYNKRENKKILLK